MKRYFLIIFSILTIPIFAQIPNYQELLNIRLKKDSLYTQINDTYQISKNNYNSTKLQSYITADLSTGPINFAISSNKNEKNFSINPTASISSPMLNNLGIQFSFPYSNSANGDIVNKGFSTGLSFDIYSQSRNKMKLELENAEYALSLLENRLKMQEQLIEKKLLTEIKKIFGEYSALLGSKMQLTMEDLKYRQILTQGYKKNSPKLRTAKLSLMRTERNTKETEFSFLNSFNTFTQACKIEIKTEDIDEFFINLAESIAKKEAPNFKDLKAENYLALINAKREYGNLLKQNKMARNIFSAQASASFSTSKTTKKSPAINTENMSLGTGITMNLPGCTLSTGVDFPLKGKNKLTPNLKFSFSFNPIQLYNHIMLIKNTRLNEENELIKLEELTTTLEKEISQLKTQIEKIKWQQNVYAEELLIYKENLIQHKKWLKQGIVSELEKKQAELEYQQAMLRTAQSNIDAIIFNIQIKEDFKTKNSK